MKPIRVLCVVSTLDRGGAESMVMSLFRHIDRDLVTFDFVKHTDSIGAFEKEIGALGGRIYSAPRYRVYNHYQYTRWWLMFLKEHEEYQIIHGHYFTISSVYFSAAHKCNRITIGHSHTSNGFTAHMTRPIADRVANILILSIEKNSDYCMACSYEAGKWLFPNKEFIVLKNAIDVEKFSFNQEIANEVRKELCLDNSFVVGNVGRFSNAKNPLGTIEIFYNVHKKLNNSKLLWAGDGPLRDEVCKLIKEYGIQDCIILTGVRSDVERLMQAMDVFIMPSFFEGLPVSAIEAQSIGIPCYISDAVTREVDVTGLCHFLPKDDSSTWTNHIVEDRHFRKDTRNDLKRAGYDIRTSAKWLQDFYIGLAE